MNSKNFKKYYNIKTLKSCVHNGEKFLVWSSRDIALIISISVMSFVYAAFVSQLGNLITGIVGFNYLFTLGHAILISVAILLYEGRRWRFLFQSVLVALLFIPTYQAGTPFDVLARIPIIINTFLGDLVFNSLYSFFRKLNQLKLWAILTVTTFWICSPFLFMLNLYLFYPPERLIPFWNTLLLMLPVIIIESIIGGYLGYNIYERVKNNRWIKINRSKIL
jgi:hypothetical protein